ncbi:MAG: hypothetical protein GY932_08075, partial [Arcobacter sp.]|nr:hypothetical protein [Arcobacter sp.]
MYKLLKIILVVFALLFVTNLEAQNKSKKKNYISIIVPEEEITETPLSKYRLAANTLPGSKVTI